MKSTNFSFIKPLAAATLLYAAAAPVWAQASDGLVPLPAYQVSETCGSGLVLSADSNGVKATFAGAKVTKTIRVTRAVAMLVASNPEAAKMLLAGYNLGGDLAVQCQEILNKSSN